MNIIKPKKLEIGDTIGIAALCGAIEDREKIYRAKDFFENCGYKVVLSENIFDEHKYLAGTDEKRLEALHTFFLDDKINAIVCARGGYGAIRLIDKIDYELIRNHPKIFCGYSDVTALSLMMYKKAGLVTYSGPMAYGDFGADEVSQFTIDNFFKTVAGAGTLKFKSEGKIYHTGQAEGTLWGGNLATVVSLCGQDFLPEEKFIFFAEDLNEPAYKIDKMFTQLVNIAAFRKNLSGIILGDFLDVDNDNRLDEFFTELANDLKIPVFSGFKITHAKDKITLPIGAKAELTSDGMLTIENA